MDLTTAIDNADEQNVGDELCDNIEVQATSQEIEPEHEDVPSEPNITTVTAVASVVVSVARMDSVPDLEGEFNRRVALHDCLECNCCSCLPCTIYPKGPLLESPLLEGRTVGWMVFDAIVFPLVPASVRVVWVVLELLSSILGFSLSLASLLGQDQIKVFNYLHLALSSAFVLLSILDAYASIIITCMNCECHQVYNINTGQARCKSCCACNTKSIDILRIILAEALLYPLVLCSVFEIVTGRAFEGNTVTDRISFALLINSCLSFVLYVSVARIVLVGIIITKVQKARMRSGFSVNKKETYSISALFYQLAFLSHVFFQTVVQILALIAVSVHIYIENIHFYEDNTTGSGSGSGHSEVEFEEVHASGLLWTKMAISYTAPVMGILSFFMVTNYWAQEFPIALYLDMYSLWKEKGVADDAVPSILEKWPDVYAGDFDDLHDKNWFFKLSYPFRTLVIVIACILYAILQTIFSIFLLVIPVVTIEGALGNWWFVFFCIVIGIGAVANAYTFTVAAFWTFILPAVVVVLLVVLLAILAVLLPIGLAVLVLLGIGYLLLILCGGFLEALCDCLTCGHSEECRRNFCPSSSS